MDKQQLPSSPLKLQTSLAMCSSTTDQQSWSLFLQQLVREQDTMRTSLYLLTPSMAFGSPPSENTLCSSSTWRGSPVAEPGNGMPAIGWKKPCAYRKTEIGAQLQSL